MRQFTITGGPPLYGTPEDKFSWIFDRLNDIANASAEGVIDPADVGAKAPILSPVFTGDPQGPTPAANDNSSSLATTEFVQTELADYATTAALAGAVSDLEDAIAAIPPVDLTPYAGKVQTDFISGIVEYPQNKSYTLINLPYGFTVKNVTTKSSTGTCTATFEINATALGGTANSVSTTETTQAHTTANVLAVGDDLVLTISSNATCKDLSFTVEIEHSLAGP